MHCQHRSWAKAFWERTETTARRPQRHSKRGARRGALAVPLRPRYASRHSKLSAPGCLFANLAAFIMSSSLAASPISQRDRSRTRASMCFRPAASGAQNPCPMFELHKARATVAICSLVQLSRLQLFETSIPALRDPLLNKVIGHLDGDAEQPLLPRRCC